ncbi:MAG: GGDEF domain-containing protein [Candidatus Dormibacteraeota bacterium]|nr:GGDEF domain-containing protein [Candidatus Dormibacteraeota bacterium]
MHGESLTGNVSVPVPNQEVVSQALVAALAEKLHLDPEALGRPDPEAVAAVLHQLTEARREGEVLPAPVESHVLWWDPHEPPRRDVLTRALRDELALQLGLQPAKLAHFSGVAAAHTLMRLRQTRRQRAGDERSQPEEMETNTIDRREVVGRAVRDGLAERLAVPPRMLSGLPPELAALTLLHLIEMRIQVWQLTSQLETGTREPDAPPVQERREMLGRTLRELIAEDLNLHPRMMGGLSPIAGASLLARLTAAKREVNEAKASIAVDEMTGAVSRRAGEAVLEREVRRARRLAGGLLVVAFLDLDSLKAANDTRGHAHGDWLLRAFVEAARSRLRTYDVIIRWAGDEFVCILPQTNREDSTRIMREILRVFEQQTEGHTFSTGLAVLEEDDSPTDLVARADAELYATRRRGRQSEAAGAGNQAAAPTASAVANTSEGPASNSGLRADEGPPSSESSPAQPEPGQAEAAATGTASLRERLRMLLAGQAPPD